MLVGGWTFTLIDTFFFSSGGAREVKKAFQNEIVLMVTEPCEYTKITELYSLRKFYGMRVESQ